VSKQRRAYRARDRFPNETLREELLRKAGLSREDHEARVLRTVLYRRRVPPPEGSTPDELARLVLRIMNGRSAEAMLDAQDLQS
jgi:hypothetical protein